VNRFGFSVREEGDSLIIVCEDDGAGVEEEEKRKIFRRGVGKNTGYGLFLAREILAITGLSIREVGTPGQGARFEIVAPCGTYRLERAPGGSREKGGGAASSTM
jgi:sensor histidine kinase regulating citrate/malate metabolism